MDSTGTTVSLSIGMFRNKEEALTGSIYDVDTTKISPKVGFSLSAHRLYIARGEAIQEEVRLTHTLASLLTDETTFYIITGSSTNGLSICKNGVKVASSTSDESKKH